MDPLSLIHTLTFDLFGTILDLGGSHAPQLREFLKAKGSKMSVEELWERWRNRQRLQQYEDNLFYTGHFGYLDSSRRALIYTLRAAKLPYDDADIRQIMDGWHELNPFPDAIPGLERLCNTFRLVVLSNGERDYLGQVLNNHLPFNFDRVISVEEVGVFKPSPQVYRYASRVLNAEPCELMMVSAHSFDAVGARASGYRAAYINRYDLPYDETPYQYDIEVRNFLELAERLGCK
jgi:2-haloacid dehalogenase